jgi:hypothetical protein
MHGAAAYTCPSAFPLLILLPGQRRLVLRPPSWSLLPPFLPPIAKRAVKPSQFSPVTNSPVADILQTPELVGHSGTATGLPSAKMRSEGCARFQNVHKAFFYLFLFFLFFFWEGGAVAIGFCLLNDVVVKNGCLVVSHTRCAERSLISSADRWLE